MIDGKVRNTVTTTSSNMRCYLCKATSKQFNNLEKVSSLAVSEENLRFGIATLHAWIHFMEYFLHLGYKLPCKKWQARSAEKKEQTEERKKDIHKQFKQRLGLIVDSPKVGGFGNSNDGNTARRFFGNSSESAKILCLDFELLNRVHIILQVLSCGFAVDVDLFKEYCLDTAKTLVQSYSWYYMPTSVHIVLIHGPLIVEWAPLPIGQLSEEAQESRNKDIKRYRENFSRKCSRESTMTDIFHWLLVSSDPLISSLRLNPPKKNNTLSSEALKLLTPIMNKRAEFSPGNSDISSDEID